MIPLLLPWLLFLLLLISLLFFLCNEWLASGILLSITMVVNWWVKCIPFRAISLSNHHQTDKLRFMTFNINSNFSDVTVNIQGIASFIKLCSPDAVFICELSDSNRDRLDSFLGNEYLYSKFDDGVPHGFYSKYPIGNWQVIEKDSHIKGSCSCRINVGGKMIALYGCHFASNNYNEDQQYFTPKKIKNYNSLKEYLRNILTASAQRAIEAQIVSSFIQKERIPVIVMGDFNDVCGSRTMYELEKAGLKNAWWESGVGYGATIHYPLPYRIDHILHSNKIKLLDIKKINIKYLSDHDALIAEFENLGD